MLRTLIVIFATAIGIKTVLSRDDLVPPNLLLKDIHRDVNQLILSRGFTVETHKVTTADDYELTVYRIVNPRVAPGTRLKPVILQHGLMGACTDWLIGADGPNLNEYLNGSQAVGPNLGFELALRGYDVWLGNSRGNKYSLGHRTKHHESGKAILRTAWLVVE